MVWLLWRPCRYGHDTVKISGQDMQAKMPETDGPPSELVELIVAKNRDGDTFTIPLKFKPAVLQFAPVTIMGVDDSVFEYEGA